MPRHLISDAHEWINEIPTVPICDLAKPQPRERAWHHQRGKKTLLSLTLVWCLDWFAGRSIGGSASDREIPLPAQPIRLRRQRRVSRKSAHARSGQVGSLAGAAHLLNHNASVPRRAQGEQKSPVEQKGKCSLDPGAQCARGPRKRGLSILQPRRASAWRCQKSYHRDNWLVAAKRS